MTDYANAACLSVDPEVFFPEPAKRARTPEWRAYRERVAEAKEVCAGCPIRAGCLEDHIFDDYGIFGGLTGRQRQKLRTVRGLLVDRSKTWSVSQTPVAIQRRKDRARAKERALAAEQSRGQVA